MAQFLKSAELTYSRSMIRQPRRSRTISSVQSVGPESATRISSATGRTDSMHARICCTSSLHGIKTVSLGMAGFQFRISDFGFRIQSEIQNLKSKIGIA